MGMTQQTPLDSIFGSGGTNPLAGIAGLKSGLQSPSGGTCKHREGEAETGFSSQGSGLRRGLGNAGKNMSFFVPQPYGPGLNIHCAKQIDTFPRCFLAPFSTQNLEVTMQQVEDNTIHDIVDRQVDDWTLTGSY